MTYEIIRKNQTDSWIDLVYLLSDKGIKVTVSLDDEVTVYPFLLEEAK